MASIVKRGTGYSVVYRYEDELGQSKQKWKKCSTYKEAQKVKADIEHGLTAGTFVAPASQTVQEFLEDFVSLYGEQKWGVSMYTSSCGLINNYINPIIGHLNVQDITSRTVDKYIQTLRKTPAVSTRTHRATTKFLTDTNVEKIIKLLRCAFKQAVRWELIAKNPFENAVLPRTRYKKRDIWDADTIRKALDACDNTRLYLAMNLAFACSLRMGEILGLTWDNVHISDADIAADDAWIYVDKEVARATQKAIDAIGEKDIYHIFEPVMKNTATRIVLKRPKTESSIRKIWLPKTLAYILRKWQQSQAEIIEFLGDEYQNFNLVIAQDNGRPVDQRMIEKDFNQLKTAAGLPNVVFHSLRHSSTTYKLKLNHGDLKATQGDTGHAEVDMITRIYAHILDEDRKINAQKFESSFYSNPDLRNVKAPADPQPTIDVALLIQQLQNSPELANTLAALLPRTR